MLPGNAPIARRPHLRQTTSVSSSLPDKQQTPEQDKASLVRLSLDSRLASNHRSGIPKQENPICTKLIGILQESAGSQQNIMPNAGAARAAHTFTSAKRSPSAPPSSTLLSSNNRQMTTSSPFPSLWLCILGHLQVHCPQNTNGR